MFIDQSNSGGQRKCGHCKQTGKYKFHTFCLLQIETGCIFKYFQLLLQLYYLPK